MKKAVLPLLLLGIWLNPCFFLYAQKKGQPVLKWSSWELLENGDTINCIDHKAQKQGRWLHELPARYGEPGRFEAGAYLNNQKEGLWQSYTLNGLPEFEENYKNGLKHGEAHYYDEQGRLLCIGHYLALNAKQLYDTVLVENPETDTLRPVRIKTDVGSIRHGSWTYYDPDIRQIKRVVDYQADEMIADVSYNSLNAQDSLQILKRWKSFPHVRKTPDPGVWMTAVGKKRIRYTDIPEKAQSVTPNTRKR